LVREVRRQMRPLERQATSARSYVEVESELRVARQALFAQRLEAFAVRRRAVEQTLADATASEATLRAELVTLDAQATTAAADMASRREEMLASTLGTLQGLAERARGTLQVIAERERSLKAALMAATDENVTATLEADAARLEADLIALNDEEGALRELREQRDAAVAALAALEADYDATWGTVSFENDQTALRAATQRVALLERSLQGLDANAASAQRRLDQARTQRSENEAAVAATESALTAARATHASSHEQHEAAVAAATVAETNRQRTDEELREASDVAARAQARAEALARALDELSGSGGRALLNDVAGVLGSFLDLIEVDAGWERAVESAAGASVGAMVVDGRSSAQAALEVLRREGGVGLILPAADADVAPVAAPTGTLSLRTKVRARTNAPERVTRVLDALLSRAFVADDWRAGVDVAVANPDLVIVTRDGDRFASSGWRVASGRAVITRATVEEAQRVSDEAQLALEPAAEVRRVANEEAQAARSRLNAATTAMAQAAAEVQRLERDFGRLTGVVTDLTNREEGLDADVASVVEQATTVRAELAELVEQLPALQAAVADATIRAEQAEAARRSVVEARRASADVATSVSRREAEFAERRRLIEQRQREIETRLEGRTLERQEAAQRRQAIEFDIQVLGRLAVLVQEASTDIRLSQEAMDSTYREQLESSRASAEKLEALRTARRATETSLATLTESTRAAQVEQAELAVKVANLYEAIRRDLHIEPDALEVTEITLPEGVSLEQRVGDLEARITSLGPINPLALEELAALEERYQELDAQVADVRSARRELLDVVRALDEEIMATFSEAVADVNEHFSTLIAMLFPGGQGRLLLTEPDDPLNTGVEIEVRPMGRNVRRISLLSGGERSMAALAFLFAVFKSRPSPFYMMDEVEAALDDVNLQRFLHLVDEFRDEAQLLIVTHQKRTMESADALYGVTMVPGASSKVISQRVKRSEPTLEFPS
jgi:chromosome segregation protein